MATRYPVRPVTDAYSPQYLLPHTKTDCSRQEFYQLEKLICDPENLGWGSMLLNNANVKKFPESTCIYCVGPGEKIPEGSLRHSLYLSEQLQSYFFLLQAEGACPHPLG